VLSRLDTVGDLIAILKHATQGLHRSSAWV
jgi:hypothetical protein